jgi:hypothetical protein
MTKVLQLFVLVVIRHTLCLLEGDEFLMIAGSESHGYK